MDRAYEPRPTWLIWAVLAAATLVALAAPSVASGQPLIRPVLITDVASLPASAEDGRIYIVTDAVTSADCTTGGGSEVALCAYDVSAGAYVALSGGGGGGGDITDVGGCAIGACFQAEAATHVLAGPVGGGVAAFRALTDADIPDSITVDLATLATTATTANAGDSATTFFPAGTIEHERGGLEADVSAFGGLVRIAAGATTAVTDLSGLNAALGTSIADGAHTTDTDDQSAAEVAYTPTTGTDWTDPDPTEAGGALDALASRLTVEEAKADDDVPESGDFGAATDLDADGSVSANAVALGTDTTGNYVASITSGSGITGGDGGSEGAALTIAATLGTSVSASEMATEDHGDISWSAGVASVDSGAVGMGEIADDLGCTGSQDVRRNAGDTAWECYTPSGGVGGSTGATDEAVLRADGTGGSTAQASSVTINDSGDVRIPSQSWLYLDTTKTTGFKRAVSDSELQAHVNSRASFSFHIDGFATRDASNAAVLTARDNEVTIHREQVNSPAARTCTSDGTGAPGTLAATVSGATYLALTNSDPDGCVVTLSETGATNGQRLEIVVISNAGGTVTLPDTAGVQETGTGCAMAVWGTYTLRYAVDRWVASGCRASN